MDTGTKHRTHIHHHLGSSHTTRKLLAHTWLEEEAANIKVVVTIVDLCESFLQDLSKLNQNLMWKSHVLELSTRDNYNGIIHVSIEDLRQHYI
jgi:hypothetical protein